MSKRKRRDNDYASPPSSPGPSKGGEIPNFISKLVSMLEDVAFAPYISWNKDGTTIIVHDVVTFQKMVLPRYFKHGNFASFARQLNM